ncbi:MAG: hypothetical protein IIV61_09415 [Oscillospiraceae bacterium]|nr:hypothetical protein [Oscillospiraceae bacterium]
MYQLPALYDLADQKAIAVLEFPMVQNGSMSVMTDSGTCWIGMDPSIRDGGPGERVHLSHELGHCITGSFYNIHAAIDCRQRHEDRANKWAIRRLIPVSELDDAIAEGHTELWDLADWFGVTEPMMRKAVCLYVHGNTADQLYF